MEGSGIAGKFKLTVGVQPLGALLEVGGERLDSSASVEQYILLNSRQASRELPDGRGDLLVFLR